MCNICRAAIALWSKDDDAFTNEDFEMLTSLAKLVDLIPGSHMIGAGVTGGADAE